MSTLRALIRHTVATTLLVGATVLPSNLAAQRDSTRKTPPAHDSLSEHRLKPVDIVATPAGRAEPFSASHVDATAIRMTPSQNPYDLLRLNAGVEVHQQGQGPGFASNASVRGFSSDHSTDLALWIDGVPINEPVNGHAEGYNDFSVLFPGGVQDIDVVRGPTSALFGNFAMAGVVNVRTLERLRGTEVTAEGGSFGHGDAMVMTGFDHGSRGGGVLGLRYLHEDGFRPNALFDVGQGHVRLVHDLRPGMRIDAGAELLSSRWNSPGFLSEEEFANKQYDIVSNASDRGYKQRAQERVSLRMIAGSAMWRSTVYATQGKWQLYLTIPPAGGQFEGSGSQTEEEDGRYGFGATSAVTWQLARGELTAGTEGRWDHANYENYFTTNRVRDSVNALVSARQLSGALFVQSHFDVTDKLRVDAGVRFDDLYTRSTPGDGEMVNQSTGQSHGVVSPKLGALMRFTPMVGVYTNISRGFRSTDGIISDPSLAPIVAWNYEAGVKFDRTVANASVMATASLFRMDVSNEQTFNPLTGAASNGGESRRQGLELDVHSRMGRLVTLSGEWTVLDARYRHLTIVSEEGDEPPANVDGLRVYNTARYTGVAAIDIGDAASRWRLRVSGNWVGPYSPFDEPGTILGAYGLAHVSGSVHLGSAWVDVGVRNALDRAYPELVAGHLVSPGQPRTLFAKVRTTF